MNTETIAKPALKELSKKPKLQQKLVQDAFPTVSPLTVFGSHKAASHRQLREQTLSRRRAKIFSSVHTVIASGIQQGHGVELTDDAIIWDGHGNRVPRIIMPIDRIDQLSQFRKS